LLLLTALLGSWWWSRDGNTARAQPLP
jgi:hypothetical protein